MFKSRIFWVQVSVEFLFFFFFHFAISQLYSKLFPVQSQLINLFSVLVLVTNIQAFHSF